jgi:predicted PhzF superfamily epimerase YddE/YHI9
LCHHIFQKHTNLIPTAKITKKELIILDIIIMTTATTANFVRRAMASAKRRSSTATANATGTKPSAVLSVEKITARVFCLGGEGGNPVTIFASQYPLPGSIQRSLAKTCQWESVILTTNDDVPSNNADDTTSMASSSIASSSIASSSIASSSSKSALPSMAFFMPSGEEVSFCAHAAIGLAMGYQQIISRRKQKQTQNNDSSSSSSLTFQASMTGESFKIDVGIIDDDNDNDNETGNQTDDDVTANVTTPVTRSVSANRSGCKSTCRLYMTSQFQEQTLSLDGQKTLKEWSDKLNWSTLLSSSNDENGNDFDNCNSVMWRNASIARPKTLIQLDSIEAVHRAIPPPLPTYDTNSNATTTTTTNFADACNIMDDSTGIYVYAPRRFPQQQKQQSNTNNNSDNSNNNNNNNNISFECRQFPRSSGYQEDPATGIAAAALAASLHFGNDNDSDTTIINNNNIVYDIYQGTAMGRPSLIQVVDLRGEENDEEEKNNNNSDSSPRKNKNKNTNISKDFRISFGLQGKVEIDDHCTIEVLCNDDDDGDGQ